MNIEIFPAVDGSDYTHVSTLMTFISGATNSAVQCVDISILEDDALEGNQTFTVTLTTPDLDVMLGNDMNTITITDNDG